MKKIFLASCVCASLLFAKELNIGVIMPLSGSLAAYGQSALEGIKIAHSMKDTLANGDKVKLVVVDTKGDKLESANAASRLVHNDKALGLIGEMVTANTLQVMRVAEDQKVPVIAPAATGDKLLNNKLYSSRVCFMDSFQGSSLAKYLASNLNKKSAVIVLDQSTDYSLGLAKAFRSEFSANGGKIVSEFKISSGDKDYRAIISKIKSLNVEVVYLPIYYTEASLFVRQAKSASLNTLFASADGVADETFIKLAGEASEGYIFTDSFDHNNPPTEASKHFIAEFEKQKGSKEVPNFTAMGADAYGVMFEAMNACVNDLSSECINNKIHQTNNFQGVSGVISIDKSGNAKRSVVVKEIKNAKQAYKDTINP